MVAEARDLIGLGEIYDCACAGESIGNDHPNRQRDSCIGSWG